MDEEQGDNFGLSKRELIRASSALLNADDDYPLNPDDSSLNFAHDANAYCFSLPDEFSAPQCIGSDRKRPRFLDKSIKTRISTRTNALPDKTKSHEGESCQSQTSTSDLGGIEYDAEHHSYEDICGHAVFELNAKPYDFPEFPWVFDLVDTEDEPSVVYSNLPNDASHYEKPLDEETFGLSLEVTDEAKGEVPSGPDSPLYTGASITVADSLAAILSFVQCEHLSGAGFGRLLSLIALHLPQPSNFSATNHNLFKLIERMEGPVSIHYFCSNCYRIRSSQTDICNVCTDESRSVCYFIQFPLVDQITHLFKRPDFVEGIMYKHNRVKENPGHIEDIYDSETYKEAELRYMKSVYDISFMWNTDGIQVFNSTTFSLWPFYLCINELSPTKRFASENMVIAGLWGSLTKPHPNLFLLPIYQELKILKAGIDVDVHGVGKQTVHAECLCGSCDSPARACFFNQKTHSGFHSCPICLIRGSKPGDSTIFPFEENLPMRSMVQYEEHVQIAVEGKVILTKNLQAEEKCFGIKGPTVLSYMVPNMFSSTAIDSMHCIYLGVMRQLMHLWLDPEYKKEPFSLFDTIKSVNHRLQQLKVPHFLQRVPRNVEKLIHWKASELRNFMLYLAPFVLRGVLNPDHFDHFMLLVQGVSLFNSSSISNNDITFGDLLLHRFVQQFADMYGLSHMSYNLHLLLHLAKCVRSLGNLWAVSCFQFEDMNGRLTNFIHGTRHTGLQIYSNLSIITKLPLMIKKLKNQQVKVFCQEIAKRSRLKLSEKIAPGLTCVGVFSPLCDSTWWLMDEMISKKVLTVACYISLYLRFLKSGVLYVSSMYRRGVRDSSCVKYLSSDEVKYGRIECFVKTECDCETHVKHMAVVRPFTTHHVFENNSVPVKHILKCDLNTQAPLEFISVTKLLSVTFLIELDGSTFLSIPLNKFEME